DRRSVEGEGGLVAIQPVGAFRQGRGYSERLGECAQPAGEVVDGLLELGQCGDLGEIGVGGVGDRCHHGGQRGRGLGEVGDGGAVVPQRPRDDGGAPGGGQLLTVLGDTRLGLCQGG